jgi:anti-sigma-K factor RskA
MKSATLRLWTLVDSNETLSLGVHSVTSDWDEATLTYATKPEIGAVVAVKALSVGNGTLGRQGVTPV